MCKCISCSECGGTGNVWFSFPGPDGGKYLGNHRSDDLDEMDSCPQCEGRGIAEMCATCAECLQAEGDF